MHVIYLAHGGGKSIITQTVGMVLREDADWISVESIYGGTRTIYRNDILALNPDSVYSHDEVEEIFQAHKHRQRV